MIVDREDVWMKRKMVLLGMAFLLGFWFQADSVPLASAATNTIEKIGDSYVYEFRSSEENAGNLIAFQSPTAQNAYISKSYSYGYQIRNNPVAWAVYNALQNNIEKLKTGKDSIRFSFVLGSFHIDSDEFGQSLQAGMDAFDRDYSEVFWIEATKMIFQYTTLGRTIRGEIALAPDYSNYFTDDYQTPAEVETDIRFMDEAIASLTADLPKTDYERVKFFHDYLIDKNEYNRYEFSKMSPKAWKITSGLHYGSTDAGNMNNPVCEGYARSLKVLCDAVQIPNMIVSGDGDGEPHMWNYVMLEGKWYAVDVTWDDPIYLRVPSETLRIQDKYAFFLKGLENFPGHVNDGSIVTGGYVFSYPTLSLTDYVFDPNQAETSEKVIDLLEPADETQVTDSLLVKEVKTPTISTAYSVYRGKTKVLKIYGLTSDAKVVYTSGNKNIVYVYQNGKIKGMNKGTTKITATVTQGGKTFKISTKVTCRA